MEAREVLLKIAYGVSISDHVGDVCRCLWDVASALGIDLDEYCDETSELDPDLLEAAVQSVRGVKNG